VGVITTVSTSLAVLLSGVGSGPFAPSSATVTVLVMVSIPTGNGLSTWTVTVCVTLAPPANVKVGQVTTLPVAFPPSLAATKVVPVGRVSVIVTPVACSAPRLLTVMV
jgi:hypothetical protein